MGGLRTTVNHKPMTKEDEWLKEFIRGLDRNERIAFMLLYAASLDRWNKTPKEKKREVVRAQRAQRKYLLNHDRKWWEVDLGSVGEEP